MKTSTLSRNQVGALGEQIAAEYFLKRGAKQVCRNWRCAIGEIDLVVWDSNELVFVEVKSRVESRNAERYLFASIDSKKRKRLKRLVNFYLYRHYWRRVPAHRIDAVGVVIKKTQGQPPVVRHLRGVVRADD